MTNETDKPNDQPIDQDLLEAGGMGTESITALNIDMPRLKILQIGSPQLKKDRNNDQYLSDARVGDFFNTATADLWRESITVIPCDFHTHYIEWPPTRGKKAPVKDYGEDVSILNRCVTNDKNQHTLPNGNRVEETAYWYLLVQNGAEWRRVLFQLTSTRLTISRKWLTAIRSETVPSVPGWSPPLFFRAWTLQAIEAKNDIGGWAAFKPVPGERIDRLDPSKQLLALAKAFSLDARAQNMRIRIEPHDGPTIEGHAVRPPFNSE